MRRLPPQPFLCSVFGSLSLHNRQIRFGTLSRGRQITARERRAMHWRHARANAPAECVEVIIVMTVP